MVTGYKQRDQQLTLVSCVWGLAATATAKSAHYILSG